MSRGAAAWDSYWFAVDSPVNLAVMRIVAAGVASWILWSRDFTGVSALPPPFWSSVSASERWRFLLFPGHSDVEHALLWCARGTALLALTGVAARLSAFVTGLLLLHLAPLESIVWTASPYGRGLTLPLLALLLAAVGPSGDALALRRRPGVLPRSWAYGWPIRLLQLLLAQVYLFSAYGKIRTAGLSWASADNLRNWVLFFSQNEETAVFRAPASWLSHHSALLGAVAAGTLLLELGFVAALVHWRGRAVLAVGAIAFHAAIFFVMNITFSSWPLLLVFFDWSGAVSSTPQRSTQRTPFGRRGGAAFLAAQRSDATGDAGRLPSPG